MVNVFVQEFKCWPMNSQHLLSSVDMTRSVIPLILHLCAVWLLKKKKKKKNHYIVNTPLDKQLVSEPLKKREKVS